MYAHAYLAIIFAFDYREKYGTCVDLCDTTINKKTHVISICD